MVSSSICGSCVAHSGWMLAVASSPAKSDVLGVHDLQVGQVNAGRQSGRSARRAAGPRLETTELLWP